MKKFAIGAATVGLLLASTVGAFAAQNPNGTGQPSQSCEEQSSMPKGFSTDGFAHAGTVYAGGEGSHSLASGNSHAVSQYDVACYQVSQ